MRRAGPHVIVVGNEKGGSGKSTTAFHLTICLMRQGFRVASMDVDSRQQTLTHAIRNRRAWAAEYDRPLPQPTHFHLPQAGGDSRAESDRRELSLFREALGEIEREVDFIIIDTPGFDTNLSRLAHSIADTLVTPVNDSLIDLNVLGSSEAEPGGSAVVGHYARLVQKARAERLAVNGQMIDWVLVRNRMAMLNSRNMRHVEAVLERLAGTLGCRIAEGIAERVIFRSLFSCGLTVFDPLDEPTLDELPSASHATARLEYLRLVSALNLPLRRQMPPLLARAG